MQPQLRATGQLCDQRVLDKQLTPRADVGHLFDLLCHSRSRNRGCKTDRTNRLDKTTSREITIVDHVVLPLQQLRNHTRTSINLH